MALKGKSLNKIFIEDYIETQTLRLSLSSRTKRNKVNMAKRFLKELGENELSLYNAQIIFDKMLIRGVKPSSVGTEIKNLKAFTAFLFKKKLIRTDWGKDIIVPKIPLVQGSLPSVETVEKIIFAGTEPTSNDNSIHIRQKNLKREAMMFVLKTGLRASELRSLRIADLYLYGNPPKVRVHSKGGDIEFQPLPVGLAEELKAIRERDILFPISIDTCNDNLRRGIKILGMRNISLTFHDLRAVYGNTLARNGATMPEVMRLMRHKQISTTMRFYIKYGIDELADVQNASHPLNRRGLDEEKVIEIFIKQKLLPFFDADKRFFIPVFEKGNKNEWIIKIKKNSEG